MAIPTVNGYKNVLLCNNYSPKVKLRETDRQTDIWTEWCLTVVTLTRLGNLSLILKLGPFLLGPGVPPIYINLWWSLLYENKDKLSIDRNWKPFELYRGNRVTKLGSNPNLVDTESWSELIIGVILNATIY